MSTWWQDVRYVLRGLSNRPSYALTTALVLAVAIGANATVFSVLNGFFLRPLPYADDDRLVSIYNTYPNMSLENAGISIPDYLDRREQAPSLEDIAIYTPESRTLSGDGEPEQLLVMRASPSLFNVLGVAPALGRAFVEAEAVPGDERVAVLSHELWTTRFGAREDVLGSDAELDGERYRIVGVMPQSFAFPNRETDVWVPFAFTVEQMSDSQRGMEFSEAVGRLRAGATIEGLNAEMDAIVQRSLELLPVRRAFIEQSGFTGRARFLRDVLVGDLRPMLLVVQGIVLAVLLIACANVANLQLTRVVARRKELSVRAVLGAGPRRLARLVLIESFVLAVAGAVAGLAISVGGLELVRNLGLDRANVGFEFAFDPAVIGFTVAATFVAALVAGLLPLISTLREDLIQGIHEAGRLGGGGRSAQSFRGALVVVQITLSVALLVAAGLLTKSFYRLAEEGPGFDAERVWTAQLALSENGYPSFAAVTQFHERALEALRALPGVSAAGITSTLPFSGNNWQSSTDIDGYTPPAGAAPPHAQQRVISEDYLPALGIPVIAGRNFAQDESERVAIIDENMANAYWPEGDALGARVRLEVQADAPWYTVVGVVPPVKQASLAVEPTKETVYWHYKQRPLRLAMLVLRTTLPPDRLTGVATEALRRIDPGLPLTNVMSMEARVERSMGPQRAPMVLTLVFAAGAFVLAVVGIYGVLSWAVTQRYGEIGVRMALGAKAGDIVRMVLTQGGRLIATGLAFGIAGAIVLGVVISSQIYDVSALDPAVFAIAVTGLAAAALLASWLPARRASRIDPMRALREE